MNKTFIDALNSNNIPLPPRDFRNTSFLRWGKNQRYWAKQVEDNGGSGATTAKGYVFGDFARDLSFFVAESSFGLKPQSSNFSHSSHSEKSYGSTKTLDYEESKSLPNAADIYAKASDLTQHPYCEKKQINIPVGLKYLEGQIVVPISDGNELISLQFIDYEGRKKYLKGSRKSGGCFEIGKYTSNILVTEGLATGCSVFESTNLMTVVAFDAGNLSPVVENLKKKYPEAKIIICADNDQYSDVNMGIKKATGAAKKYRCCIAIPEFLNIDTRPTDFNDLMILEGSENVKEIIMRAIVSEQSEILAENFGLGDNDLFYLDSRGEPYRISNYIKVSAMATDENDTWGRFIELKDFNGIDKQVFIADSRFTGNCETVRRELANLGVGLESSQKARDLLNRYLTTSRPERQIVCVSKPGWHFDKVFATPEKIIGKLDSEVVCTVDQSPFKKRGTLENWKENVSKYCINNSRLVLSVCSAFAAPVLDICGLANGGFHFTGRSSVGKTTCLKVAASVYGDTNYIKSWRATDNGLEGIATKYNDSLLILDEISQVDPNKVGDIAYMLANGIGKTRANCFGGAANTQTWRNLFLSSGETSLSTHMNSVNKKSQTGQDIRLLSINAAPSGSSFGIFEDLHGFQNGAELANHLIEKSAKSYGTAIVKFLENLVKNRESVAAYVFKRMRDIKEFYLPQTADGQDIRVFERFAFVGIVGEYATKNGFTGWGETDAIKGCMKCFREWLEEKGGFGNIEETKVLEQVKLFFEQYAESRLLTIPAGFQKITNMVGYKDDCYYYITPESFKNVLCKGFDYKFAIQTLKKKGWLIFGGDGKSSIVKAISCVNTRVYKLSKQAVLS